MTNGMHITVATAPDVNGEISLRNELSILKTALLYADRVTYCSMAATMLLLVQMDIYMSVGEETLDKLLRPDASGKELRESILNTQSLLRSSYPRPFFLKTHDSVSSISYVLEGGKIMERAGMFELIEILYTGICEFAHLPFENSNDPDKMYDDYERFVFQAATSGATHLMFDKLTGDAINDAINAKRIEPKRVSTSQAKQVRLASELLRRLPKFDDASLDEILDIRNELESPLVRFRSAIIKYGRQIETAAWDSDFGFEANQVFIEHVQPAILEIEERCNSNSFLKNLAPSLVDKPLEPAASSALGLLLANSAHMPEIVNAGLGLLAGGAVIGLKAKQAYIEEKQLIERNNLYFYYQAGEMLKKP